MRRILLLLIPVLIAGCKSKSVEISRDQYGNRWPFSVDSGKIKCIDGSVVFEANSYEYGVNGTSKMRGYNKIEDIWLDDPNLPGTGMDIGFVLEIGNNLCDK